MELHQLINSIEELSNIDNILEEKKKKSAKYYQEHKLKIDQQTKQARINRYKEKLVSKLNSKEYQRIPFSKIKKYKIRTLGDKYYVW
jgi:hypothetical protein